MGLIMSRYYVNDGVHKPSKTGGRASKAAAKADDALNATLTKAWEAAHPDVESRVEQFFARLTMVEVDAALYEQRVKVQSLIKAKPVEVRHCAKCGANSTDHFVSAKLLCTKCALA